MPLRHHYTRLGNTNPRVRSENSLERILFCRELSPTCAVVTLPMPSVLAIYDYVVRR